MTTQTKETQLAKIQNLQTLFEQKKGALSSVLPKHLTSERVIKIALSAISRNPLLLECTQMSILHAVMFSCQYGLEIGGPLRHAHLVPFFNSKIKRREAIFIPGYEGIAHLVRKSEKIINVHPYVVHANDKFSMKIGTEAEIEHIPAITGELGEIIGYYSLATWVTGQRDFEFMTKAQVDKIKDQAMANKANKDVGPWIEHEEQMGRKTVLKRHCHYLPLTKEAASAVEYDNRIEVGNPFEDLLDIPGYEVPPEEDLEDQIKSPTSTSEQKETQKNGEENPGPNKSEAPPTFKAITKEQKEEIFELGKKAGKKPGYIKAYLKGAFGIEDLDSIPEKMFEEVKSLLRDLPHTEENKKLF